MTKVTREELRGVSSRAFNDLPNPFLFATVSDLLAGSFRPSKDDVCRLIVAHRRLRDLYQADLSTGQQTDRLLDEATDDRDDALARLAEAEARIGRLVDAFGAVSGMVMPYTADLAQRTHLLPGDLDPVVPAPAPDGHPTGYRAARGCAPPGKEVSRDHP